MGNPIYSSTLEQIKDLRQTNRVKIPGFRPDVWQTELYNEALEKYRNARKSLVIEATYSRGFDLMQDVEQFCAFFEQFCQFYPAPRRGATGSIKDAIEGIAGHRDEALKVGIRAAFGKDIIGRDKFDDLYNKFAIKYYRALYDFLDNNPKNQKRVLADMKSIFNDDSIENIQDVDRKIAELGYQFTPYNFRRKRDRVEFTALQRIVTLNGKVETNKIKVKGGKRTFKRHLNYILYYLCEVDNPEEINIYGIAAVELKQIATDATQYKHYDKVRKVYLLALREELLRIVGSDDPKFDTQKKALAKEIADLLGIARKDILDIIDRSDKKELNTYIAQEFARFDISIPSPQDKKHFDSNVNGLIASLLTTWRELETSCPTASAAARDIAFQLAYERHVTPQLHAVLKALNAQLTIDKASEVDAKIAVRSTITQRLKDITNYRNSIYQNHQDNFRDAHLALKDYLENGRMPTVGNPSFIALIELLDKYVDPKSRYEKQSDGTYAAAAGLKPFLKAFENAKSDSVSDYENQQQVLTDFFDYVWQQLDIQQRYDLQDFDPSMPSQALLNATFVRDGKHCLNEFAREFGIHERGIKRNHPVEKLYLQINKLMTLLDSDERKKFVAVRNKIIGKHNISTIRHLPMHKITNMDKVDNPNKLEDIHTLTELKRFMQAEIRYTARNKRIDHNLKYLRDIVREASETRPNLDGIDRQVEMEENRIKIALLQKNGLEIDEDINNKVDILIKQGGQGIDVYYRDMQKLRAHLLAHLIAHNIPVASMNPLGDLEPVVSEYHRVDKRRAVSATKQAYRDDKSFIAKISGPLALLFGLGQMANGIIGMAIFPQYMAVWLAYTLLAAGSLATLRSNHNFVYSVNKSLLRRLYVLKDVWLGYTSLSGKLFITTTYASTFMFSAVFAVVVGTAFVPFAATTPLMMAAFFAYQGFASLTIFVTLSNMSLFMAVAVSDTWDGIYNGLASLFPELGDANDKAAALGKSLGFTGLVAGISRGMYRFVTRDINQPNILALRDRIGRYIANPTKNPGATGIEKFYKHVENILLIPYTIGFFSLATWLCYLSCTSTVAAWSGVFSGSLLAFGVPVAVTSASVFICVSVATNAVNTLFNVNSFSSQALNLSSLFSKLTVDVTMKLPIALGKAGVYTLHQVLSGELFYKELFGEKGIISTAWANPGKAYHNFKIDAYQVANTLGGILLEVYTNIGNAVSFSAPIAMEGLKDTSRTQKGVATDFASNVSNSSAANAGGTLARYGMMMPTVIPQAFDVIGKFISEKVTSKVKLDAPQKDSEDTTAPSSRSAPADKEAYDRYKSFFTSKGKQDLDMNLSDSLRPVDVPIDSDKFYAARPTSASAA